MAQPEDELLVLRARSGDRGAERTIFERHAPHVARVLARILGAERDIGDRVHDVFIQAFSTLKRLREPRALKAWLTGIAVNIARGEIRRQRRRRWLSFLAPEELPELPAPGIDEVDRAAVSAVYAVLEEMAVEDRLAFSLRVIAELQLGEVAEALGVSLATAKRRIARAEQDFRGRARGRAELSSYLEDQEAP